MSINSSKSDTFFASFMSLQTEMKEGITATRHLFKQAIVTENQTAISKLPPVKKETWKWTISCGKRHRQTRVIQG